LSHSSAQFASRPQIPGSLSLTLRACLLRFGTLEIFHSTASGAAYVLPYRFRKIRQLDRSWAVMAGSYIIGQRMLDLLNRERSSSASHAQEILQRGATAELALLE